MTEREIIERICGSCGCDEATAKEYLNDETLLFEECTVTHYHIK